jgi:hypothetical protein
LIQDCLLEGGRLDSRSTDGRGMGFFRTVCDRDRPQARATSRGSSAGPRWDFLDCAYGCAIARSAGRIGQMELRLSSILAMAARRAMGHRVRSLGGNRGCSQYASNDRLNNCPRAPSRSRRKAGFIKTLLAVRAVGSRPKSISVRMQKASRSAPRSRRVTGCLHFPAIPRRPTVNDPNF